MKRKGTKVMAVLVMAFMIVAIAAGCGGNAGEDLAQDLGEGLAEKLSGGEISTDNEWPDEMPASVPEMKDGKVVNSTAITVGGKTNVTISLEDVSDKDFADYVSEIEDAGFEVFVSVQSGGIDSRTFGQGQNALSVQYASKSGELIITYTGD